MILSLVSFDEMMMSSMWTKSRTIANTEIYDIRFCYAHNGNNISTDYLEIRDRIKRIRLRHVSTWNKKNGNQKAEK
jgi:hypothetical protein